MCGRISAKVLLFSLLALFLCSLSAYGLTDGERQELKTILMRYEQNETELLNRLQTLKTNLSKLETESSAYAESLRKEIKSIESSLIRSQWKVKALQMSLTTMGESITTLESSLKRIERQNAMLKYGAIAAVAVAVAESLILIIR